ncbi:DnaB-like helicase C-terminal domain-containing protein [Mesorhizobium sp.]|uniref:DnaB-like helicase C-terminal domain-containing protein n=1 Tax=Mesorhizobium sp. TaxID=1871066 RepID=UPI000FE380FE|nr:DnaB-like helicase C-terminal domain-containing protein [Mesorhizobium sp.]RWB95514.1 MAG: DNA helicase [Mesorhizobium sp.]RWJ03382.1 MAG: DNA helicase [Mesorhizobium sp.]
MPAAAAQEEDEEHGQYDFDAAFQLKIATLFLRDTQFAMRVKDLLKPEYFSEDAVGIAIRIGQKYVQDYKAAPERAILPLLLKDEIANKRIRDDMKEPVKDVFRHVIGKQVDLSSAKFVADKVSDFARHQAIQDAMVKSVGFLEKGDFAAIEKTMKAAINVGILNDTGEYDYWKEIASRTQLREDFKAGKIIRDGITTGVSEIDSHLYHGGWGRKELSLIMGAAKAGKSLSLGEFTKNASLAGYNVFYDSCEVAARIIADRIDAALADTAMRLLKDDPQTVAAKIRAAEARAGAFKMREHASGTLKPSQLHRIVENYRSEGVIMDLITVDYADIMAAEYRSDNLIDNMRSIYIDLRAIAFEFNAALLTATQTNREGAKKATAKMTDVAEDFNKIRTADVVLGINATDQEKASNEARLTWVASRNSEDGFSLRIRQDREKLKFLTKVLGKE